MSGKFTEFKRIIEKYKGIDFYDLLGEIVRAYEKGEIDCNEYIQLYELLEDKKQEERKEQWM